VLPVICFTKIGQYTLAMFVAEIEWRHTEKWLTSGVLKTAEWNIGLKI
jgi:hypothetical protein